MAGIRIQLSLPESRIPPDMEEISKHSGEIEIIRKQDLEPVAGIDLLVFSADRLQSFLASGWDRDVRFFCSGDARQIRHALVLGAWDFLREPWEGTELIIRAERSLSGPARGSLKPDPGGLTLTELRLFWKLGEARGKTVSRKELEEILCQTKSVSRALDVHIWSLRRKIEQRLPHWEHPPLVAVRSQGYQLDFLAYGAISMVR